MKDDRNAILFPLGKILATPGAIKAITNEELRTFIYRHQTGSWEEVPREDRIQNMLGLFHRLRIISTHTAESSGKKILIITEADRSVTTLLLPEEY